MRLNRIALTPRPDAAHKRGRIPAMPSQLQRRTGARRLVLSGAVQDNRPVRRLADRPVRNLVRQHTYVAWNPWRVAFITGARPYIQDVQTLARFHPFMQILNADPSDALAVSAKHGRLIRLAFFFMD